MTFESFVGWAIFGLLTFWAVMGAGFKLHEWKGRKLFLGDPSAPKPTEEERLAQWRRVWERERLEKDKTIQQIRREGFRRCSRCDKPFEGESREQALERFETWHRPDMCAVCESKLKWPGNSDGERIVWWAVLITAGILLLTYHYYE